MAYDSTDDTKKHQEKVAMLLQQVAGELRKRAGRHDDSKLHPPEKEVFDRVTPLLKGSTYGSEEYKRRLEEMGEGLKHHYKVNSHHPEYHVTGIHGMNLIDLVEMLCDWKAATLRHKDGDIVTSIIMNGRRFNIDNDLTDILQNTIHDLGWENA